MDVGRSRRIVTLEVGNLIASLIAEQLKRVVLRLLDARVIAFIAARYVATAPEIGLALGAGAKSA